MLATAKPPGPRFPWITFGAVYHNPIRSLTKAVREYGDVVHLQLGSKHHFLLNHPDYIRAILLDDGMRRSVHVPLKQFLGRGLLSSEGTFHQRYRRLIQPAFHKQRIYALGEDMIRESLKWSDRWQDGATVDLHEEMLHLTMAIVGRTLFSVDFTSDAKELGEALDTMVEMTSMKYKVIGSIEKRVPLLRSRRRERARQRLDEMIFKLIEERRRNKSEKPDLLTMLVQLRDSEDAPRGMSDQQVRDEILTLFTAGHETIASALMWTWYLLAENPEAAARLHAEIESVIGNRTPVVADMEKLAYTRMVLSESMRLYPPVWIMGRRALRDTPIGGYVIPAGSHVHVSQFLMHRDGRYFPEPEKFRPERWLPEAVALRPKFSYFPFGGGGLQCIGEGFAWTEGVLVVATLAQRWKMRVKPGHRVELEPRITLRSKYGMPVILERRR